MPLPIPASARFCRLLHVLPGLALVLAVGSVECRAEARSEAVAAIGSSSDCPYDDEQRVADAAIRRELLVLVVFDPLDDPWFAPPLGVAVAAPLSAEQRARATSLVGVALAAWPRDIVTGHLSYVRILSELWLDGVRAGGTYWGREIMLTFGGGETTSESDILFVAGLHHEFSSLLIERERFPLEGWLRCNPTGWRYLHAGGLEALREFQARTRMNPDYAFSPMDPLGCGVPLLFEMGFVDGYSLSSVEEDFSEISAMALTRPDRLACLCADYPALATKCGVLLEFWDTIDAGIGRELRLALRRAGASVMQPPVARREPDESRPAGHQARLLAPYVMFRCLPGATCADAHDLTASESRRRRAIGRRAETLTVDLDVLDRDAECDVLLAPFDAAMRRSCGPCMSR